MKKANKKIMAICVLAFFASLAFLIYKNNSEIADVKAASTDRVRGFAWSENIGWISFNNTNTGAATSYGVDIFLKPGDSNNGKISGYAWSENIGWITFNKDVAGKPPSSPYNNESDSYMAKLNTGTGVVTGWARAISACRDNLWDGAKCTGAGAGNKSGGWDGWIKLRKSPSDIGPNYGVSLSGNNFIGWAWGGDVVGWVSFNSVNCDTSGDGFSDGALNCPLAGTPIPDYEVYLDGSSLVSAENLKAFNPNYCNQPSSFSLEWTYKSLLGINQARYNIQAATDAFFTILAVNVTSIQVVVPDVTGNGIGTTALTVVTTPTIPIDDLEIGYGSIAYYWRLRVQDSNGNWSNWVEYDDLTDSDGDGNSKTFTTENHMWPTVDFSPPSPSSFMVNSIIDFTNNSVCYDSGNIVVNCTAWDWDFCGGITDPVLQGQGNCAIIVERTSSLQDPSHVYDVAGTYDIILTVTDADGHTCSNPAGVKLLGTVRPKWKEIIPR